MTTTTLAGLDELRVQFTELRDEIEELANLADITDEQTERLETVLAEAEELRATIGKLEQREARIAEVRAAHIAGRTEPGADPGVQVVVRRDDTYDLGTMRANPYGDHRAYGTEIRDRALRAIEENAKALDSTNMDRLDQMVAQAGRGMPGQTDHPAGIARHIVLTGSPEYRQLFSEYVSGDATAVTRMPSEARAALSLTGANGGFLVPFTLDPTVVLSNVGAVNPFRTICGQVSITTDDWSGVTSAGVTAEWLAEATEAADASPTFAQPSITVNKASAYIQASLEVVMDSGVDSEIARLIADAKDRLEATAFATGSGSGQPLGIMTQMALVTASRVAGSSGAAGAADLAAADIYALDNALGPRWRSNATFVANKKILNDIRQLGTANLYHAFWTDFGGGMPPSLIGYPVYESSAMDSTVVSGSNDDVLVLGDFRNGYKIVDRVGLAIAYNPLVLGSNRRPSGEVGWFAYWRVGGEPIIDDAFRSLRL